MTTSEPVLRAALQEVKDYVVFGSAVNKGEEMVPTTELSKTLFRLLIGQIEGVLQPGLGDGRGSNAEGADNGSKLSSFTTRIEVSIHAYGMELCQSACTRHSKNSRFDEWLSFSITYDDLPLDVVVCCNVYDVNGLVAGTTFYPFSSRGVAKWGTRRYRLHRGQKADPSSDSPTTHGHITSYHWDKVQREFDRRAVVPVQWLDTLTMRELQCRNAHRQHETGELYLTVQFPVPSNNVPVVKTTLAPADSQATLPIPATPFVPYTDYEIDMDNICEAKAALLSKSLHLVVDRDAQPNYKQRQQINAILALPPITTGPLSSDQSALLWQFRYFLLREPLALRHFLLCVDFHNPMEAEEAVNLLQQWKPPSYADALVLLSSDFRFPAVRKYAITLLADATDDRINLLLLQLVQAVRYDTGDDALQEFLIERAVTNFELVSNMFWYVSVEVDLEDKRALAEAAVAAAQSGRRNENSHVAVEGKYRHLKEALMSRLSAVNKEYAVYIHEEERLRQCLRTMQKVLATEKDRVKRLENMKRLVDKEECGFRELFRGRPRSGTNFSTAAVVAAGEVGSNQQFSFSSGEHGGGSSVTNPTNIGGNDRVYCPLHPGKTQIRRVLSEGTYIFKSAKMPILLPFEDQDGNVVKMMFKSGDDVRQDQLVIQMIQLMDSLLQQNGMDLHLTPYRVLATSQDDGFVEVVANGAVVTIQSVEELTVLKHLKQKNPDPQAFEASKRRFVRSCAGYCVITYLLGIGDRHLENLLLTDDGCLLHIDFGFILGVDPKPFPPPMKLCQAMIDGMGGVNSATYQEFKSLCCSCFIVLRKHAHLILNLLLLMLDAQIDNISSGSGKADPKYSIMTVQNKLRLDLNDAEATQYIQRVIQESVSAVFTNLWDDIHKWAGYFKT